MSKWICYITSLFIWISFGVLTSLVLEVAIVERVQEYLAVAIFGAGLTHFFEKEG